MNWTGTQTKVAGGAAQSQQIVFTQTANANLLLSNILPGALFNPTSTGQIVPVDSILFTISVIQGNLAVGLPVTFVSGDGNGPSFSFNTATWYLAGQAQATALPFSLRIFQFTQFTVSITAYKAMVLNDSILFSLSFDWVTFIA